MYSSEAMAGELIGAVIGGLLFTYLFGLLAGLAFKRMYPDERAVAAAICGWVLLAILVAFTMGLFAGVFYAPGSVLAFFMLRRHYRKLWEPDTDELTDTFS